MVARRVALVSDCKSETYAPPPIYIHTCSVTTALGVRWQASMFTPIYTHTCSVTTALGETGSQPFNTHTCSVTTAERAEHAISQRNPSTLSTPTPVV